MANMLFANNCNTTLSGSITAVATSMVVTSATGFPSPTGSQYFYCTLADAATQTTIEIVKVTAVSGTTFTIVRGQDGTSGTIFASGAVVSLRLVRASLNDFPKLDENNTFSFAPTFNTALAVGSGGTGLITLTAGYIPYGNGTGAFSSSSGLNFDGSNLGVGATPTAASQGIVLEMVNGATIYARSAAGVPQLYTSSNAVGTGFSPTYKINGYATQYIQQGFDGSHSWLIAPSGTAGNAITFTERMRIASNGIITMSAYGAGAATFSASGVISSVSDETWKIKDGIPTNPDEMLQKLEPGYWFYNQEKAPIFGEDRQLGFYAQNVNAAIGAEAAPTPEEGKPWGYYDRSVLAVTVMSLKNALNTIQEQQVIIKSLITRIETLETK